MGGQNITEPINKVPTTNGTGVAKVDTQTHNSGPVVAKTTSARPKGKGKSKKLVSKINSGATQPQQKDVPDEMNGGQIDNSKRHQAENPDDSNQGGLSAKDVANDLERAEKIK